MKKLQYTVLFLAVAVFAGMGMSKLLTNHDVNLSNFGMDVTVSVPEGAEVKKGMLNGEVEGVTLYSAEISKDWFKLSVSMWDESPETDLAEAIAEQKEATEENEAFKEYIVDEDNGFIAKTIDEGEVSYEFSYILEKDDRHILFTEGFTLKNFTEENIKVIYNAAKAAK
jgi:hypothetical protein